MNTLDKYVTKQRLNYSVGILFDRAFSFKTKYLDNNFKKTLSHYPAKRLWYKYGYMYFCETHFKLD